MAVIEINEYYVFENDCFNDNIGTTTHKSFMEVAVEIMKHHQCYDSPARIKMI